MGKRKPKDEELSELSDDRLVHLFAVAARAYGELLAASKTSQANKNANRNRDIYQELKRRGPTSQSHILDLLEDENLFVRYGAAANSLEFSPELSIKALEKIASTNLNESVHVPIYAEHLLNRWRAGHKN